MMLLHGEQSDSLNENLKIDAKHYIQGKIVDCQDKKKGAVIIFEISTYSDENLKNLIGRSLMSTFIRGLGNFDQSNKPQKVWFNTGQKVNREPDFQVSTKTLPSQAILYRLNGDFNPLHIDPDMASLGGFPQPILHGLCTYGMSNRLLIEKICNGSTKEFRQLTGRFTSHVFPGETLVLNGWKLSEEEYYFETSTKERGLVVL